MSAWLRGLLSCYQLTFALRWNVKGLGGTRLNLLAVKAIMYTIYGSTLFSWYMDKTNGTIADCAE